MWHFVFYLVAFLIAFKILLKLTTRMCKSSTCLVGKTVIVTGGDSGIGYETSLDFAKRGARVIITSLYMNEGLRARERIIEETDNENIVVKPINLKSFKSVRAFAKDIIENEEHIDILVNNAGVPLTEPKLTENGLGALMQVNYFSLFLLTNLLLDKLKQSKKARIVNVSSLVGFIGRLDLSTFQTAHYSTSKLCVMLFTRELAERLKGTSVTTYSLHPGLVSTPIIGNVHIVLVPFIKFFMNATEGAQTTIRAAVDKNIESLSGEHFHDCYSTWRYPNTRDVNLRKALWKKTEEIIKNSIGN